MSYYESGTITKPADLRLEVRVMRNHGATMPAPLVSTLARLMKRRAVSAFMVFNGPRDYRLSVYPSSHGSHAGLLVEIAAKLADLNMTPSATDEWKFMWRGGIPVNRGRKYSLLDAEALNRFAEIVSIPLLDYMTLMSAIDSGSRAVLMAVRKSRYNDSNTIEIERRYFWELRVIVPMPLVPTVSSVLDVGNNWTYDQYIFDDWHGQVGVFTCRVMYRPYGHVPDAERDGLGGLPME